MKVIGLNVQHDGGCCLIIDGRIACAISEERLTRRRGASGWLYALRYCLETTGVRLGEIDLAVFSSYGDTLPPNFDGGLSAFGLRPGRSAVIDHHLSHAASSFLASPFHDALTVVLDGAGNSCDTESYFACEGDRIERLGANLNRASARGVGKTYEAFTSFLGWQMMDSGSTMALAAYGSPERYAGLELFEVSGDQINSRLVEKYVQGVLEFSRRSGADFGEPFSKGQTQASRDVAFFVQNRTEVALIDWISGLVRMTGKTNVCLAGGVALNCVANEKIRRRTSIERLFVTPAASDKGQAVGNAMYGFSVLLKGGRPKPFVRDSFGKAYSDADIIPVLERRQELGNNFIVEAPPIEFARVHEIESEVAKLIAAGNTVGWMQGGSEIGSRALGHRSILADPRRPDIQKHLSDRVKHRAWFRPYAPSVLAEVSDAYFDLDVLSPFMLLAPQVRVDKTGTIPGVVHVDGTSRPQTVSRDHEPRFWKAISEFHALTGIPLVLNTSFNLSGEPITETPLDAVSAFLRSGLDYVAIEDYLVWKTRPVWKDRTGSASSSDTVLAGMA